MKTDKLGISAAIITALSWGLTGIFIRLLDPILSIDVLFGRLFLSFFLLLLIVTAYRNYRKLLLIDCKLLITWRLSFLQFIYFSSATFAFKFAPIGDIALLISTSPVFILVLIYFGKTHITKVDIFGVLLSIFGVAIIIVGGHSENVIINIWPNRFIGDFLALCGAFSIGVYALNYKIAAEQNKHPSAISVALIACLIGSFVLVWGGSIDMLFISEKNIISFPLIGLAVISTALPSVTYALSSSRLPPVMTTTIRMLTPAFASVFAYVFLNELPSAWILPGGLLIVLGNYIIASHANYK